MAHVVSSLEDARALLAAGKRALISPPYAACYAGVGYYRALLDVLRHEFPDVPLTFTLCCGDDAAIAHDALRLGFTHIICNTGDAIHAELQQIAAGMGGAVLRAYPTLDAGVHAGKPN